MLFEIKRFCFLNRKVWDSIFTLRA